MSDWVELLQSKTAASALAFFLVQLNNRFKWIEMSPENANLLSAFILTAALTFARRGSQKAEKVAGEAKAAAESAQEAARAC